jgi:type IV pilus assembly protein PilY1
MNQKKNLWRRVLLGVGFGLLAGLAGADDIDLFTTPSSSSGASANVMILVDNSANWARASQQWPGGGTQGQSELAAIASILSSIGGSSINVGLALQNGSGSTAGWGYIRFNLRDMSQAANRTALSNIALGIDVNSSTEKTSATYDTQVFYELYKYFHGLAPYMGTTALNTLVDKTGNTNTLTAYGQGLRSGFTFKADGTYNPPAGAGCAQNYIIYIANNAQGSFSTGTNVFESSVLDVNSPATTVVSSAQWLSAWTQRMKADTSAPVTTYVLDAYNAQNNAAYSTYLRNAATYGGGTYFQVNSQDAIVQALLKVFVEIQSVNSTFASASLPISASSRSQSQNQVFIGMFRPDPDDRPRWPGNLKRYQLVTNSTGNTVLADVNGVEAINPLTGFITPCATSYWTFDSNTYWQSQSVAGSCLASSFNKFSDSPDGPMVEKGAVAEILRSGNNPPTTSGTPTYAVNRTLYTLNSTNTAFVDFVTTANAATAPTGTVDWPNTVKFTRGEDTNDENVNSNLTEIRSSIHGDVIHSRALPIDYGGTTGVVAYYGSNDGNFRAVSAYNGKELWSFIAPEFFPRLERLRTSSSSTAVFVYYPGIPSTITPTPQPKDYFFDGSTGAYESADASTVWIFPSMRRGGRMVYGLNVSNPTSPAFKWRVGCPNLTNDTGCTSGFSGIGQTWSLPNVAFIRGFSTSNPIVTFGGGYDNCEDANSATPSCSSTKGNIVYIVNANDGTLIRSFATLRSVAADISYVDVNFDGFPDYAYVADTGGNIYRIDFVDPGSYAPRSSSNWTMNRVAYTNGSNRKFFYAPALQYSNNKVYVAIGSGDREHPLITQYPYTTPVVNRFYVYVDNLAATTANNLDSTTTMANYSTGSTCATARILPSSGLLGWYKNLNANGTGEQVVTSALIAGGLVTFSTNRPVPPAVNSCSASLGEARGYWLNLTNGSGAIGVNNASCGGSDSTTFVGGGLVPSPVFGVVSVGGQQQTVVIGAPQRDGSVSTPISAQRFTLPLSYKRHRVYWRRSGIDNN